MAAKPGRNDRCPCGSGRKYKVCCGARPAAKTAPSSPSPHASASAVPVESVLRLSGQLLRAGRYAEAVAPLSQAARVAPNDPAVLHDLGMACLFARRLPEAATWLRRAIALRPNVAATHHHLGLALAQLGDGEGALAAHLQAIALDPNLAEAHGRVAELLLQKAMRKEAAEAFERAYAASPGTAFGRLCGAKARVAQGRTAEAETLLRELLAAEPSAGSAPTRRQNDIAWVAHMMLGNLLNESGRFDEAAASFERAIAIAPSEGTAYHNLVSTRRVQEADRPLVGRMLSLLDSRGMPDDQRMRLHFAAGKALDDLRDHAAAIQQFDAANGIRGRTRPLDRAAVEQQLDRLTARFSRELFASSAALGASDETPVLVLGMPRSGTTLVERIVSSHPKVAGGGELEFWNERGPAWVDADTSKLAEAADRLRADYLALLRSIGPDALRVTDKMPFNYLWIGVVHLLSPRARIIHCRRNPIDTCLSIYTTSFNRHLQYASSRADLAWYYRRYVRLMDHWRAVLPPDRFLDVDYEEATASPEPVARRLVAFCGLEWDPACLQPERNPDAVKTASVWQARQPIYRSSVERWRNYEPWIGELRELVE
jgi:tetratricopeptide (TPR) repeat protein